MVTAIREDFHRVHRRFTSGGYAFWEDGELHVVIDSSESQARQRLIAIHEVIDGHLRREIKHSRIDRISIDIIDVLQQVGLI